MLAVGWTTGCWSKGLLDDACGSKGLLGTGGIKGVLGAGSTTGSGSGSLNWGTIGETSDAFEPEEPNGDGIGGVVIFPGEFGSIDAEPDEPDGEEDTGGLSGCENGDGGVTVTGLRSGSMNAGGAGVAEAGGISITGSSGPELAAISFRISASETNCVFIGSDAAGI